jgi:ABC-type Na+ transport system ATPase subunit NatA
VLAATASATDNRRTVPYAARFSVSFLGRRGEIVVLLGTNGAGTSSCLKALGGIVAQRPAARTVLDGVELVGLPAHEVVEVSLVLEQRGIFAETYSRRAASRRQISPRSAPCFQVWRSATAKSSVL